MSGLPLPTAGDETADLHGKFFASPWGEPGLEDDRVRIFNAEVEASEYALALLPQIGDPERIEHLNTTPGDRFVVVGQFRDDDEAREEFAADMREFGSALPLHVPWGWADSTGYHGGSYEESSRLWP